MPICEFCGKEFDEEFASTEFLIETQLWYENLTKCLCDECAIKAVDDEPIEDVYFDECERCGKRFDMVKEDLEFISTASRTHSDVGTIRYECDEMLCSECALDCFYAKYDDDDDDDGEHGGNGLSLEDAALIYASNGCDEDYTYGYSEDELEDYLK